MEFKVWKAEKMWEFPEPLWETYYLTKPKICLACGQGKAESVLRNGDKDVCPLCKKCAIVWNGHGYCLLKRIKPLKVLWNIYLYKLRHWWTPSWVTIYQDIRSFYKWATYMKKFKHLM